MNDNVLEVTSNSENNEGTINVIKSNLNDDDSNKQSKTNYLQIMSEKNIISKGTKRRRKNNKNIFVISTDVSPNISCTINYETKNVYKSADDMNNITELNGIKTSWFGCFKIMYSNTCSYFYNICDTLVLDVLMYLLYYVIYCF